MDLISFHPETPDEKLINWTQEGPRKELQAGVQRSRGEEIQSYHSEEQMPF